MFSTVSGKIKILVNIDINKKSLVTCFLKNNINMKSSTIIIRVYYQVSRFLRVIQVLKIIKGSSGSWSS